VVNILSIRAGEKGIRVRHEMDETARRRFSGDMGRLRQVLLNLTGNAVKFTETGEVVVALSAIQETESGATLRFSVRDTGIGISGNRVDALFEPFSQTDASISRRFGGTGLGLTISKNIVEMMGGEIGVKSEPGRGSTFWFSVTLEKAGNPETRETAATPPAKKAGELRVLLAEDNPFNQKIMQIILNNLGIQSDVANDGRETIRMLAEKRYDLVLMDIQMPKMDGIDATRAIRESGAQWKNIPIVALTAHAMPEQQDIWLTAGMNGYLIKPVKPEQLRETIYSHLEKAGGSD
jgi:CheY-like chemotaxis protein